MSWNYYGGFRPYVSVAQRRAKAQREVEKRKQKGQNVSPVVIEGRKITKTFWGESWCEHLESFSDYANRLPRGRTYVRNGSVVDLQIKPGKVTALVSGSDLYEVTITIDALPGKLWNAVKAQCSGQIGSLVELLQGRLSRSVMDVVTQRETGLFPKPREIRLSCSCPDWADMCKHVAAVLYGVGARLDHQPDLLFLLRKVDHLELIDTAASASVGSSRRRGKKTIAGADLADVFGIELAGTETETAAAPEAPRAAPAATKRRRSSAATAPATPADPPPGRRTRRRDPGALPVPPQTKQRRSRPRSASVTSRPADTGAPANAARRPRTPRKK
jgi:uncharacterized Zn finger protein